MSPLSDREKAVLETRRMRLHTKEALQYLKDHKVGMSQATYFRKVKSLEDKKMERLHYIAAIGFEDQHLERIDTVETCIKLMWDNYHKCEDVYKAAKILESIISAQPYLSSYYEASKEVLENIQDATKSTEKDRDISDR